MLKKLCFVLAFIFITSCSSDKEISADSVPDSTPSVTTDVLDRYSYANGCFAVRSSENKTYLKSDNQNYQFADVALAEATPFYMKPTNLGSYVLYDSEGYMLSIKNNSRTRTKDLDFDAEWVMFPRKSGFILQSLATYQLLTETSLTDSMAQATELIFEETTGCKTFPEISTNTEGEIKPKTFADGSAWGMADIHGHIATDLAFGETWFHGKLFHPLGVEHALSDCDELHGEGGYKSIELFFNSNENGFDIDTILKQVNEQFFLAGFNHHTTGYPEFLDWPQFDDIIHTLTYYKWIERAYLGGLRLIVQLSMSWEGVCNLTTGSGYFTSRLGTCNEMVSIDRQIEEMKKLERYVDAQSGGPGKGWFRIAYTSSEAREYINQGKLAVVLGIETSALFDCFQTPREGFPECDIPFVKSKVDEYYEKGIRTFMPAHISNSGFGAGDGHKGGAEVFQLAGNAQFYDFTSCTEISDSPYDRGVSLFNLEIYENAFMEMIISGLLFSERQTLPFYPKLNLEKGEYHCLRDGWTAEGEFLLREMMRKGLLIEESHLAVKSLTRARELMDEASYPGRVRSHGFDGSGSLTKVGGVNSIPASAIPRCVNSNNPRDLGETIETISTNNQKYNQYDGVPFGFDINGTIPAATPRFGEQAACDNVQDNSTRLTYPFTSFDGEITFTESKSGNRVFDFNEEGMSHFGMLPELIEDMRLSGSSKEEVELLFKGAEKYLRTWEAAEKRAAELKLQGY